MTNNTKQGLIVSIGFLVVLIAFGVIETIKFNNNQRISILSVMKYSLEQPWLEVVATKSNAVNKGVVTVTSVELWAAYCENKKWSHSSVSTNLWLSREPVQVMSTNIVSAWSKSDDGAYAIDARGVRSVATFVCPGCSTDE